MGFQDVFYFYFLFLSKPSLLQKQSSVTHLKFCSGRMQTACYGVTHCCSRVLLHFYGKPRHGLCMHSLAWLGKLTKKSSLPKLLVRKEGSFVVVKWLQNAPVKISGTEHRCTYQRHCFGYCCYAARNELLFVMLFCFSHPVRKGSGRTIFKSIFP